MWDGWVNISRSEDKQSEVLRTDNQQLLHNFQQNARFNIRYILNPSVCVHDCHYLRDLGEERYQLRPTFSAPCSRTRDQIAALMLGFYIPNCFKLRSRQASRAKQQTLPCFLFKQSIRLYRMRRMDDKIRQ